MAPSRVRGTAGMLAAVLLTVLAACGSSDNSSSASASESTAKPQKLTKVTFLYSPFADYAPFFLAKDKGYFEEFGVDARLVPKRGTSETVQLVASGKAEAGPVSWGAAVFNAIADDAPVEILATVSRVPTSGSDPSPLMISEKAWDAGIRTITDLRGKKVGIPGPGGFGIYDVALALKTGGLTVDDVQLVNIGPPDTAAAFANGSLDAGWTIEPITTSIKKEKFGRVVAPLGAAGTEVGALAFNADFAKSHPQAVIGFTAAMLKGVRELANGGWEDATNKKIVAKWTKLPADLLDSIALMNQPQDGNVDVDDVRAQEAFFREQGDLQYEGDVDIEDAYRKDLLDEANARLESATP